MDKPDDRGELGPRPKRRFESYDATVVGIGGHGAEKSHPPRECREACGMRVGLTAKTLSSVPRDGPARPPPR